MAHVLGIELSPELCELARENLQRARGLRCSQVEIINADAMNFSIPPDATLFYFQNPFAGSILATVLENIKRSIIKHPRPTYLLCNVPPVGAFEREIRKVPWLRLEHSIVMGRHKRHGLVFRPDDSLDG
jgi:hypothetical protein